jgi:hypothetical protein
MFVCWSAEAGPVHGASLVAPGQATVRAEIGMAGALPTVLLGGTAGLSPHLDLGAHAVTHAGLAYAMGGTLRWRARSPWGLGLTVDESFYTVEDLAGIESSRSPFGRRVAVVPQALATTTLASGVQLGWALGAEVGTLRVERIPGEGPPYEVQRVLRPALDSAWGEVAASWPRPKGAFFVRLRAIVPVATEFHVLGYLPWVAVGRTWGVW